MTGTCEEYINSFRAGHLEETTGTSSYNVVENYLAGLEIQEDLPK